MKAWHLIGALVVLAVVLVCGFMFTVGSRHVDVAAGVIRFPSYQGTATMDKARDMIYELGWTDESETGRTATGKPTRVTFAARDGKDKPVTFDFTLGVATAQVKVATEADGQYTRSQLTSELARRLGMHVEGQPLKAETAQPSTSG